MSRLSNLLENASVPLDTGPGRERYAGALLGLAVGNALGGPVEGLTAAEIRQHHPDGLTEIAESETHTWDDDVAQAIALAESLLPGPLDPDAFLDRLVRWFRESGRGIGRQTRAVLRLAERGPGGTEAARRVWEESGRTAAGNGAVMRCAPVGLRWRREPGRLVEDAIASARVTHYDPRSAWTAVAVSGLVALATAEAAPELEALADAFRESAAPEEVVDALLEALTPELSELGIDEGYAIGYTVRTMTVAAWAFVHGVDFESTLIGVVNAGGDTDTNGAVVGAILGARYGAGSIPDRWIERLPDPAALRDLAERLRKAAERSG